MNYKFKAFESELSNPTIESVSTAFTIGGEFVTITVILNANGSKLYGVELGQMPNTDTWGDAEVQAFALAQLETFKV
tara:strand:- start:861 stop:1091 length:231 start_codon:yes stop_codon:yes gene_type:complete